MPPEQKLKEVQPTSNIDKEPEPILKQIRTFQGDVAEALKKQQESIVSIQRAEHIKNKPFQIPADKNSKRIRESFFLSLGSIILFVLGTAGAWYGYSEFIRKSTSPIMIGPENRFISVNTERSVELFNTSRETFFNTISNIIESVPSGEIAHITLSEKNEEGISSDLSIEKFLKILESRAPSSLIRAIDPLFMFGSFGNSPFLLIKLTSFENAFAGMLGWEKNLAVDLGPLFTEATFLKDLSFESVFTDITDRNKDARILSIENQTIILYSFFDNNMLIITDNIGTLRTLIDRLTRQKLSR